LAKESAEKTGRFDMKKAILLFVMCGAAVLWAQEKSEITVKSSELSNHVIMISAVEKGKSLELHCNDGQAFCMAVKPGNYQMVRLAKNHGMYDCQNVDLYPTDPNQPQEEKLGEYCLYEK